MPPRHFTVSLLIDIDEEPTTLTVTGRAYPAVPATGPSYHSGGEPGEGVEIAEYTATDDAGIEHELSDADIDRLVERIDERWSEPDDYDLLGTTARVLIGALGMSGLLALLSMIPPVLA